MNYHLVFTNQYFYRGYLLTITSYGIIFNGFLCSTLWDVDRIIDNVLPLITTPTTINNG